MYIHIVYICMFPKDPNAWPVPKGCIGQWVRRGQPFGIWELLGPQAMGSGTRWRMADRLPSS